MPSRRDHTVTGEHPRRCTHGLGREHHSSLLEPRHHAEGYGCENPRIGTDRDQGDTVCDLGCSDVRDQTGEPGRRPDVPDRVRYRRAVRGRELPASGARIVGDPDLDVEKDGDAVGVVTCRNGLGTCSKTNPLAFAQVGGVDAPERFVRRCVVGW